MSAAALKWFSILMDVLAYEANHTDDGELLSEFCDRIIERRPVLARVAILSVGLPLTLHLANLVPWQGDVISSRFWKRNYQLWKAGVRIFDFSPRENRFVS